MTSSGRVRRAFPEGEDRRFARYEYAANLRRMSLPASDLFRPSEGRRKRCRSNALSIPLATTRELDRIEVRFEINALILPDAGVCLDVNAFVATRIRCEIDIINRQQRLGDEKMR